MTISFLRHLKNFVFPNNANHSRIEEEKSVPEKIIKANDTNCIFANIHPPKITGSKCRRTASFRSVNLIERGKNISTNRHILRHRSGQPAVITITKSDVFRT